LTAGLVLNALGQARGWALELGALLGRRCVTTNHFDVDACLAVWAYTNRAAARQHEPGACVCRMVSAQQQPMALAAASELKQRRPRAREASSICTPSAVVSLCDQPPHAGLLLLLLLHRAAAAAAYSAPPHGTHR
jgi:hypothetical protein